MCLHTKSNVYHTNINEFKKKVTIEPLENKRWTKENLNKQLGFLRLHNITDCYVLSSSWQTVPECQVWSVSLNTTSCWVCKNAKPTIILPPPPPPSLLLFLLPLLLAVVLSASPSGPQLKTIRPCRNVLRSLFNKTRFTRQASDPFSQQSYFLKFFYRFPGSCNFYRKQGFLLICDIRRCLVFCFFVFITRVWVRGRVSERTAVSTLGHRCCSSGERSWMHAEGLLLWCPVGCVCRVCRIPEAPLCQRNAGKQKESLLRSLHWVLCCGRVARLYRVSKIGYLFSTYGSH